MKAEQLLEFLYSALNSKRGIEIETSDAERLRQRLYAIRRKHEDTFESLAFVISPINGRDLWIINKEQAIEE